MLYQENNSVGQNFFECIRYLDFQYLPHMHKHPELIHVREGMVTVESDGKNEEIEAGGYALILSNRIHAYYSQKHSVVDVCIFQKTTCLFFRKKYGGKSQNKQDLPAARRSIPLPRQCFLSPTISLSRMI